MIGQTLALLSGVLMLLLTLWSNPLIAGDAAGNGGDLGTKNFIFEYRRLPLTIDECLSSSQCVPDPKGRTALIAIRATLQKQHQDRIARKLSDDEWMKERIEFVKGTELTLRGRPCSAMTGNTWKSPMRVQTDHLYETGPGGIRNPVRPSSLVALQIDEAAHQAGLFDQSGPDGEKVDHTELDRLAALVQAYVESNLLELHWKPRPSNLSVSVHNFTSQTKNADLLVRDDFEIRNLNDDLARSVECPKRSTPMKVVGLRVFNIHEGRNGDAVSSGDGSFPFRLFGRVSGLCVPDGDQASSFAFANVGNASSALTSLSKVVQISKDFVVDMRQEHISQEGKRARELKLNPPVNPSIRVLPELSVRVFDCQEKKDPLCH